MKCPDCTHDKKAHKDGRCTATVYVYKRWSTPVTVVDYTYPCACEQEQPF